jgi:Flp pilus assembly protein TadG
MKMQKGNGLSVTDRRRRRAAAVVEFAVISPVLLTILFGIIEYGYVFMVRQTLNHAAREACRVAVLQTTDYPWTEVTDRVDQVMNSAGLSDHIVEMTHATADNNWTETVAVRMQRSDVSLLGNYFGDQTGKWIVASCSMRKEGIGGGG